MGGIIVKDALAMSYHEQKCRPLILTFAYGVFFFSVPHKGSASATWWFIASFDQAGHGVAGKNESFSAQRRTEPNVFPEVQRQRSLGSISS